MLDKFDTLKMYANQSAIVVLSNVTIFTISGILLYIIQDQTEKQIRETLEKYF